MKFNTVQIALLCEDHTKTTLADNLAADLGIPIASAPEGFEFLLVITETRLELRQNAHPASGPLFVDFSSSTLRYRRERGGGRKEPLAKAVGLKANRCPTVLDATAGLGRDSFMLASMGCHVHMLERSAIVAALLKDGIRRAESIPELNDIMGRITIEATNSYSLTTLPLFPDVIYLDPMYPHRSKSALVKKEMRLVRALVGDDHDASELLSWALSHQGVRVVVKRPKGAARLLDHPPPSFVIKSKNSRFDVYLVSGSEFQVQS